MTAFNEVWQAGIRSKSWGTDSTDKTAGANQATDDCHK